MFADTIILMVIAFISGAIVSPLVLSELDLCVLPHIALGITGSLGYRLLIDSGRTPALTMDTPSFPVSNVFSGPGPTVAGPMGSFGIFGALGSNRHTGFNGLVSTLGISITPKFAFLSHPVTSLMNALADPQLRWWIISCVVLAALAHLVMLAAVSMLIHLISKTVLFVVWRIPILVVSLAARISCVNKWLVPVAALLYREMWAIVQMTYVTLVVRLSFLRRVTPLMHSIFRVLLSEMSSRQAL